MITSSCFRAREQCDPQQDVCEKEKPSPPSTAVNLGFKLRSSSDGARAGKRGDAKRKVSACLATELLHKLVGPLLLEL